MYNDDTLPHTFSLPHLTSSPSIEKKVQPMMINAPSRSSSLSSSVSSSTTSETLDLHTISLSLLNTIYNSHNLSAASSQIHPDCQVEHELSTKLYNFSSRDEFIAHLANKCSTFPGLRIRNRECCVDERQRKVWVVSDITHGMEDSQEIRKEKVDMLSFDEEGLLIEMKDFVRRVRTDKDED